MAADSIDDILLRAGLSGTNGPWALYRQDTHGLHYYMRGALSEEAGNHLANHFNGLNHHQTYWIEIPKNPVFTILPPR